MLSNSGAPMPKPIIGCTTYRKLSRDTGVPLFGLMQSYVQAISAAGGIPVLIPLGLPAEDLGTVLARVDGLVLPGGGDIEPRRYRGQPHEKVRGVDKDRDRVEIHVARWAAENEKPLLAICRGHQVLNVALGGTMWEDIATQVPAAIRHDYYGTDARNYRPHAVDLKPGSRLAAIFGTTSVPVNSLHHQAVRDLAPDLQATATAADGIVEGLEITGHPFGVGVQWHPENLVDDDPAMLDLFRALVHAAVAETA